jgi:hypothetical protein
MKCAVVVSLAYAKPAFAQLYVAADYALPNAPWGSEIRG